ncbi:MAG TPA: GGDEF domain-containing protein [Terriglobales bacterium]|nr:GGDEF domain-containing protein [Terriglobales bacterium]
MRSSESTNGNGGSNGSHRHHEAEFHIAQRTDEIQKQFQSLTSRDLQLWSISLLIIVVLGAGFAALVAPNLTWRPAFHAEVRYLPQLFFGLISLVLLFNIYIIAQKRELNATRRALVQELIFNERLQGLSLIDPLTQLLNRRAMEQMLDKEVARANRVGNALTLLMIDLDNFKSINTRNGHPGGDKFLAEAARLLKNTFRRSDMVFRYGGDEFLVLMPDTTEQQAERAVARLLAEVDRWNTENRSEDELALSCGTASYVTGARVSDVLAMANRRMLLKKNKLIPVF